MQVPREARKPSGHGTLPGSEARLLLPASSDQATRLPPAAAGQPVNARTSRGSVRPGDPGRRDSGQRPDSFWKRESRRGREGRKGLRLPRDAGRGAQQEAAGEPEPSQGCSQPPRKRHPQPAEGSEPAQPNPLLLHCASKLLLQELRKSLLSGTSGSQPGGDGACWRKALWLADCLCLALGRKQALRAKRKNPYAGTAGSKVSTIFELMNLKIY